MRYNEKLFQYIDEWKFDFSFVRIFNGHRTQGKDMKYK